MDTLEGSDDEVVVVNSDDVRSITFLGIECPSCNLSCIVDSTETVSALRHSVYRMCIYAFLLKSLLEILILSSCLGSESVSLSIVSVYSLLAWNSCLLKNGYLLLCNRLCSVENLECKAADGNLAVLLCCHERLETWSLSDPHRLHYIEKAVNILLSCRNILHIYRVRNHTLLHYAYSIECVSV